MYGKRIKKELIRNSLVVQWLGFHALTAEGLGSIPDQGTKMPQAAQHGQGREEKRDWRREVGRIKEERQRKKNRKNLLTKINSKF